MWYELLPKILNMSLTGSVVILAVLALRLLLRKAPKVFSYTLWLVVLFRLLCPVSLPASISILNLFDAPLSSVGSVEYIPADIVHTPYPAVNLPLPGVNEAINQGLPQGAEQTVADPLEFPVTAATYIWLAGMAVLLIYSVVKYYRLRRRLVGAVPLRDNIYLADHIASPFVLGLFRPRVYLPSALTGQEQYYILLHEQYHIRRLDHVAKILAFAALCLHWFNPLVWLAFVLAAEDMEMSCDEAVLKRLGQEVRADYCQSLLSLATGRRLISGTPLAFGEGDTKGRIKNVLRYKKPGFRMILLAVLICIVAAGCLATNPQGDEDIRWAERPTLIFDGQAYVNPYMPVSEPPFGYVYAGELSEAQAHNTGLIGAAYYTNADQPGDFYVYQETGTPVDVNTVDSEQLQWAYVRWIKQEAEATTQRLLTLDDVRFLAAKGEALTWSDFERYAHIDAGFGLYIRVYEIDALFTLYMGGPSPEMPPWYIRLAAGDDWDDNVDVRSEDVESFIRQRQEAASISGLGGAEMPQQVQVSEAPILTVTANGQSLEPYFHFLWSRTWESDGWLATDGLNLADSLPKLAADLPTLILADDFALHLSDNAALSYVSVYDENFELLEHSDEWKQLRDLPSGTYYVGVVISVQGEYIPEGEDYEARGDQGLFKLIAP